LLCFFVERSTVQKNLFSAKTLNTSSLELQIGLVEFQKMSNLKLTLTCPKCDLHQN